MSSAGKLQLLSTNQRKDIMAGDESTAFHNTDNNNQAAQLRQPSAKEVAAAKAARIRLGYEQAEDEAGADALVSPVNVFPACVYMVSRAYVRYEQCASQLASSCRLQRQSFPMGQSHRVQNMSTTYLLRLQSLARMSMDA